jgi:hypothetical protein
VDEWWNVSSKIEVALELVKDGRRVLYKEAFQGDAKQNSWAASSDEFQDSLYKELLDLPHRVVERTATAPNESSPEKSNQ